MTKILITIELRYITYVLLKETNILYCCWDQISLIWEYLNLYKSIITKQFRDQINRYSSNVIFMQMHELQYRTSLPPFRSTNDLRVAGIRWIENRDLCLVLDVLWLTC